MFPLLRLCYLRDVIYFQNLKMSKDLSDPMFNRVKYLSMTKTSQDFRRWNWRLLILANLWKSDSVWLTRIKPRLFVKKSQFLYYFNNQKHLLKTNSFCLDDADDRCIFNASGNLYWLLHQKYSMIFQAQFIFSFCVNTVTRICIHRRSWFDWMNCFQGCVLFSLDKEFTQVRPYFVQY